jgi:hypothetical protein
VVAVALEIPPVRSAELALELIILGVVAVPLARLATDAGIRRRFQAFPRMQLALSGSLAVSCQAARLRAGKLKYPP